MVGSSHVDAGILKAFLVFLDARGTGLSVFDTLSGSINKQNKSWHVPPPLSVVYEHSPFTPLKIISTLKRVLLGINSQLSPLSYTILRISSIEKARTKFIFTLPNA